MVWLETLIAVITVLAGVAGILQLAVLLLDRRRRSHDVENGESPGRFVLRHAEAGHGQNQSTSELQFPSSLNAAAEYEPLWGEQPPIDPQRVGVAWRSSISYLFGWISGLVFWRNQRPEVRFHAAQSLLIDVTAVLYGVLACCCLVPYVAYRYPGGQQMASNDPVMLAWMATVLFVPPVLHVVLAFVALIGFHPRLPIIWRIAATISARRASTN